MLYLLKASRITEYRRENVAILGAAEDECFTVTYQHRWVQPELVVTPGTGGVIVFADSPYEHFVPVRFCVIDDVDDTGKALVLTVRLKPFVHVDGAELLTKRWNPRSDDDRPGTRFVFDDDNPGLFAPTSPEDHTAAWRAAVDGLAANAYFDQLTAVRKLRVCDAEGTPIDPGEAIDPATVVHLDVELRTPVAERTRVQAVLDTEPRGGAELVAGEDLPANGEATVAIRLLVPGPVRTRLALKPEPLASSRPTWQWSVAAIPDAAEFEATPDVAETAAPPDHAVAATAVDKAALLRHLRRDGDLSPTAWMRLHEEVLLPADPTDVDVLADYAEKAVLAGEHQVVVETLAKLDDRTPEQDTTLLVAALRTGSDVDFAELLAGAELSSDRSFAEVLDAMAHADPSLLGRVLPLLADDVLADDKLVRVVEQVWYQVPTIPLACRLAEKVAYIEPDTGTGLLVERWSRPTEMPDAALELLVDWAVRTPTTTPFLHERLERVARAGRRAELAELAQSLATGSGSVATAELLSAAGRHLLDVDDDHRDLGFTLLVDAAHRAGTHHQLGLAEEILRTLAFHVESCGADSEQRAAVASLRAALDEALRSSDELAQWEAFENDSAVARLRPHLKGKVLHLCGGEQRSWADELADELGLAGVHWHETSKHGSNQIDWVDGLGERDVVVIVTTTIGHAVSGPVRDRCDRSGVRCCYGSHRQRETLAGLERLFATR